MKKFADAAALFESHARRYNIQPKKSEAFFWAAEANFQIEAYELAERFYSQAMQNLPADKKLDALYGLGWSYLRQGKFLLAATAFERVIDADTDKKYTTESQLRRADSYYSAKEYKQASEAYRLFIKSNPRADEADYALYQIANAEYRSNNDKEGIARFSELIAKYPKSDFVDDAQYGIGLIHFQQKRYAQAIPEFGKVTQKYPKSDLAAKAQYSIGDAYYNLEQYPDAIAAYSIVADKYPASPLVSDAVNGMQYCFVLLGKTGDAIKVIEEFVREHPDVRQSDELYFKKGELYYGQRQYDSVISAYNDFINRYPQSKLVEMHITGSGSPTRESAIPTMRWMRSPLLPIVFPPAG